MFTGLIEATGEVLAALLAAAGGARLRFACPESFVLAVGDSIGVDGCCLTATACGPGWFTADAVPETLRRTTLGLRRPGDPVNLERPLQPEARLGGHFVQGHVDGLGRVRGWETEGESRLLTLTAPPEVLTYVVEKGSVAVDGVSLTVAARLVDGFRVAVIPHTLAVTTLGRRIAGDAVNLEADILAKYVEGLLAGRGRAEQAQR